MIIGDTDISIILCMIIGDMDNLSMIIGDTDNLLRFLLISRGIVRLLIYLCMSLGAYFSGSLWRTYVSWQSLSLFKLLGYFFVHVSLLPRFALFISRGTFPQALYPSSLAKRFIQALYQSTLSMHFVKALYPCTLSRDYDHIFVRASRYHQALYPRTLPGHFIKPFYPFLVP